MTGTAKTILFLTAVLALWAGCSRKPDQAVSKDVIDFRLDTLTHERFYLNQYRGKIVVLEFWSTWCTVCKQEMVELKALANEFPPEKVAFAGICNDPENLDGVKAVVESLSITYPVLLDYKARLYNKLGITAVPTTLVIDQQGRVALAREGYDSATLKQIKSGIERLSNSGETK
jgi:peroxiredoxin